MTFGSGKVSAERVRFFGSGTNAEKIAAAATGDIVAAAKANGNSVLEVVWRRDYATLQVLASFRETRECQAITMPRT